MRYLTGSPCSPSARFDNFITLEAAVVERARTLFALE
jgi:hypothetical protein